MSFRRVHARQADRKRAGQVQVGRLVGEQPDLGVDRIAVVTAGEQRGPKRALSARWAEGLRRRASRPRPRTPDPGVRQDLGPGRRARPAGAWSAASRDLPTCRRLHPVSAQSSSSIHPFVDFEALLYRLALCLVIALRSAESPTAFLPPTRTDPDAALRLRGHPQVRQRTRFEDISADATRALVRFERSVRVSRPRRSPLRRSEVRRGIPVLLVLGLMMGIAGTGTAESPEAHSRPCWHMSPTIVGTSGPDRLRGTAGSDVIEGLGGRDLIRGRGGDDHICGGLLSDLINAGAGNDSIQGDLGRDVIDGGIGSDTIKGNENADTIWGDRGDDHLVGGPGVPDRLHGGPGSDDVDGVDGAPTDLVDGGRGTDSCEEDADDVVVNCP